MKQESILIADDDADLMSTLVDLLKQFGYNNVISAKDGKEAISKYKTHRPNLVLMDIVMPKMDGVTAFFKIKELDPLAKVIFITAYDPPDRYDAAKRKGAIHLVKKPFSALFLKELINRHT